MNRIGIIGAMQEEVELLIEKTDVKEEVKHAGMTFYVGELSNKEVVIVKCGIGKVNAGACTQVLSTKFDVEAIINTGVAGGIYDELSIADVVVSTDVVEHDFDATSFGYEIGQIPRMDESFFKADERLVSLVKKTYEECDFGHKVFEGRIMSGDIFVASKEIKERLWDTFGGYCAEMESAAIGHVAYINEKPFVIIRAISDKADGSASHNFDEFCKEAANNSAILVEKMLFNI